MYSNYYSMNDINAKSPMPLSERRANVQAMPGKQPRKRSMRMRLLLLLIIGALVIAAVRVAANLYTADTTLILQVGDQQTGQIDLNQSFAISPYLLGSNVFPRAGTNSKDQAGSGFMSYDQPVILGLQSAGIKLLRFPGGNWGTAYAFASANGRLQRAP